MSESRVMALKEGGENEKKKERPMVPYVPLSWSLSGTAIVGGRCGPDSRQSAMFDSQRRVSVKGIINKRDKSQLERS